MVYQKQKWTEYDNKKSEEENIKNGSVGTAERMNNMENGIYSVSEAIEITNNNVIPYRRDTILIDKYNWDSFTTTGIYRVSLGPTHTSTNPPEPGTGLYGFLYVTNTGATGTHIQQRYVDYTGKEYTRFKVSGTTWNKWNRTQVQAITDYGGSSFNIGSSDGSILAVLKRDAPLYRSYAVYGPNLSDGPPSTSVFRFTAQMTDASTGNVIGVTDSGIMYYRGIAGGNWSTGWISPNDFQRSKITDDNGYAQVISSGTILEAVLNKAQGFRTYASTPELSDSPNKTASFRFVANITNGVHGNVFGVTDQNDFYYRNIFNSRWQGEWSKIADESKAQMKKITEDAGNGTLISSGTLLSQILANGAGIKSFRSTATPTDTPPISATFHFISDMTTDSYGFVIGSVDGTGRVFTRLISNKVWLGDWKEIITDNYIKTDPNKILLDKIYPIGSVYTNASNTNPGAQLGGTWALLGQGANATYMWKRTG